MVFSRGIVDDFANELGGQKRGHLHEVLLHNNSTLLLEITVMIGKAAGMLQIDATHAHYARNISVQTRMRLNLTIRSPSF